MTLDKGAYNQTEAACWMSLSERNVLDLIQQGLLRFIKKGRTVIIPTFELERWCQDHPKAPPIVDDISITPKVKRPPNPASGYVYIIQSGVYYKIGKTKNVAKRLYNLQASFPQTLQLIHTLKAQEAVASEAALHHYFRDKRTEGEWFLLSESDIAWLQSLQEIFLKDVDDEDGLFDHASGKLSRRPRTHPRRSRQDRTHLLPKDRA
jgi:hypothetical protein